MENTMVSQSIGRKKSLRRRIILTMAVCIIGALILLTAVLIFQLFSTIDTFIEDGGGLYDSLEALKIPILITFIIVAVLIGIVMAQLS